MSSRPDPDDAIDHARRGVLRRGAGTALSIVPRFALPISAAWALPLQTATARDLGRDDDVSLLPTVAHGLGDGRVRVRIDAWVHEPESKRLATFALARYLGLDLERLPEDERLLFEERARLFGRDAKSGRRLAARIAEGEPTLLPASDAQGRIRSELTLPAPATVQAGDLLALTLSSGERRFWTDVPWLADEGLAVVSDIDDTIKHTQVRVRREMLLNTFARPFAAVPGMADWYARIATDSPGSGFHYVSGGPLHLLTPLFDFLVEGAFPRGSLHLRNFSLRPDRLLDRDATARHKQQAIGQLMADFPRRRFLLVGDSGERDPEIYGAIARAHPQRVAGVLIRDVTGEPAEAARYATAFAGLEATTWRLFTEPAGLPTVWA